MEEPMNIVQPDSPTLSAKSESASSPEDDFIKDQPQYLQADSASPSPGNKTFVPCKVCGDKASGYHYGVTSCEGCKGFFRRSIQKQIEYRCLRDGKCLVIRLNRNRCQYCRFKKCLAVGMSRDSVRYGRVPKRSRERGPEEGPSREIPVVPVIIGEEQCELSRTISTAYRAHCTLSMVDRHPIPCFEPSQPLSPGATSTSEGMEAQRIWYWQQLAARMTPTAHRIVEFAKRLPGFSEFTQDDQLILIKMGFFEMWLANAARVATESTMTLEDGGYVTVQQLEIMYDANFAASMMHFITNLNALCLNDTELGLFCAAVLVTIERPGITDVKTIQQNQDKIIEAFKLQVSQNHPGGGNVLGCALITLVSELRAIGNRHAILLDWFRLNWSKLRLPPLFAEIFDIPKCDEDLQ